MLFCPMCLSAGAVAASALAAGAVSTAGIATLFAGRRRTSPAVTPHTTSDLMEHPAVATRDEWLHARRTLLAQEKELTRTRDALAAARRRLPMVRVDEEYVFDGPAGPTSLRDLFGPHRQLVVYHFMFDPAWTEGCKSCSYVMDNLSGALVHLAARDTAFAAISRAPLATIEPFRARMGWTFPWLSSSGNSFNYDFHVTLDAALGSVEYNYASVPELVRRGEMPYERGEMPGLSVFLREGDDVFHTYSTYQRGLDGLLNTYNVLDLTPLGRQEEDRRIMAWVRYHDRYEPAEATA